MTPSTPEAIHSLLPAEVLTNRVAFASMSFHAIPPFPEQSYGYLDCERDVGDGIKEGLKGSLFQGVGVGVEGGRPDTFVPRIVPGEEGEMVKKKRKRAKKDGDDDRKKAKKEARRRV